VPALHQPALIPKLSLLPIVLLAIGCTAPDEAAATTANLEQPPSRESCTVTRVTDGDSFECGKMGRVRLLMVDAPELAQGEAGRQAKAAFERLAPRGTALGIETDVRPRDDYNRALVYAYLPDGRMLNEEMARAGMVTALVYPPNVRHAARIRNAVREARRKKSGLWATSFFDCSPRDYRAGRCPGGSGPRRR
jgi:endonuclease YncB( thermonuclease family)